MSVHVDTSIVLGLCLLGNSTKGLKATYTVRPQTDFTSFHSWSIFLHDSLPVLIFDFDFVCHIPGINAQIETGS